MSLSFGIFSESLDKDSLIIKKLFDYYTNLGDVVLITDSLDSAEFQHYPIFPSFYIRFFQGCIIFLDIEDYLEYKDNLVGIPKVLLYKSDGSTIDRSLVSKNHILDLTL